MTEQFGRQLVPGPTDNAAAARTPIERLRRIPPTARRSFVPFMPILPGLRMGENDLTRVAPGRPQAHGQVITVAGRITDCLGRPISPSLVELWNANHWGRYTHIDDPARERLDAYFLGHGRAVTDVDGNYFFRTILPGPYLARPDIDRWRPRHIHFSIRGGSARLITQLYFTGDPHNAADPGFILLGDAQTRHLAIEESEGQFRFDIVMAGRNANWFLPES